MIEFILLKWQDQIIGLVVVGHWIKMPRSLAQFSGPEASYCTPSLANFITITFGFRFSVHTEIEPNLWVVSPENGHNSEDTWRFSGQGQCLVDPAQATSRRPNTRSRYVQSRHRQQAQRP